MTATLLVLYNPPTDAAAFDAYYAGVHTPLAKTLPGLLELNVSCGPIATPAGPAPYHLIAALRFDSLAGIAAALASPEGQATAGDLGNFASGGATILLYETRTC
jgi:uncharacterized protein (TIGR02118 family)